VSSLSIPPWFDWGEGRMVAIECKARLSIPPWFDWGPAVTAPFLLPSPLPLPSFRTPVGAIVLSTSGRRQLA
jgi:hypothetical protein